jgi:hypothetical protein
MGFGSAVRAAAAAGLVWTAVAAAAGATASLDRIRVSEAGGPLTAAFPPTVFLTLAPPPGYSGAAPSGGHGAWTGPEYWASGRRDLGGRTSITWTLRFDNSSKSSEAAARAGLTKPWADDLRGGVSVPHVALGRTLGTIDGDYVLTAGSGHDSASYELAMAFAVAPRVNAVLDFLLTDPADSSSPAGEYLVLGSVPAPVWNRGEALRAMSGVELEGNLPPTRVSATAVSGGALVRGTLADAFRHPVVRERVALERRSGVRWRRLTTTRTDLRGAYSFRIGKAGRYRVAAKLGKTAITSRSVLAGS